MKKLLVLLCVCISFTAVYSDQDVVTVAKKGEVVKQADGSFVFQPNVKPDADKLNEAVIVDPKAEASEKTELGIFKKGLNFIGSNMNLIFVLLSGIILAFSKKIFAFLASLKTKWTKQSDKWKTKLPAFIDTFNVIDHFIFGVVDELMDLADDYRKESESGQLTEKRIKELNDKTIELVLARLPIFAKDLLTEIVADIPAYILSKVKARVFVNKKKLV